MSGTFASLNTALSALRYNAVLLDNASHNIANAKTEGFTRRVVVGETVGAPPVAAMWSRYEGSGDGVRVGGLARMSDPLLDARARNEHAKQSALDVKQAVLERVESGIAEPGDTGVSAAMAEFRTAWSDLANNPGGEAARSQVLATGRALADAINIQARNINTEITDLGVKLTDLVKEANGIAKGLADVNRSIATSAQTGGDAGVLLDQRDQLALRLAELTGAKGEIQDNGTMTVTLGTTPGSAITLVGDGAVALDQNSLPADVTGEIGAVQELRDTTLPGHRDKLDAFAVQLAGDVNTLHTRTGSAFDAEGNPGEPFFGPADPATTVTAASISVVLKGPEKIAASSIGSTGGNLDGGNADALSKAFPAEETYQELVTGFGTDVVSTRRLAANQQVLTAQVDASRDQLAGVNLDEEMLTMVTAQRGYEAAARVMTALDSVLDTLINRTGLLR